MTDGLQEVMAGLRAKAAARRQNLRRPTPETPAPRYDDVFFEGLAWLDSLAYTDNWDECFAEHAEEDMVDKKPALTATEQYILDEEGYRAQIYRCTSGALTIGIGYNLDAGMPIDEAMLLMRHRVGTITRALGGKFAWFGGLNEARRAALVSMAYQMGLRGLYGFRRMLAAIEAGNYETAGREMLDSSWAEQTPARARRTAEMIRSGQFMTGR